MMEKTTDRAESPRTESTRTELPSESELRFAFGRNWQRFLSTLNEQRLGRAQRTLQEFWPDRAEKISFLDIGSGSGTFSLSARRLGANVTSFDFDKFSVACTRKLKEIHFADDPLWRIEQGSILDEQFVRSLGVFDIVYSWGVLHHTGAMWQALENAAIPVAPDGLLVIAIYNDQGWKSRFWKIVKKIYCSGLIGRWLITALFVPLFVAAFFIADLLKFRHPLARYGSAYDSRGMSVLTDIIDWIGGYPFEVASEEQIIDFYQKRDSRLISKKTTKGLGCNEFVFQKNASS